MLNIEEISGNTTIEKIKNIDKQIVELEMMRKTLLEAVEGTVIVNEGDTKLEHGIATFLIKDLKCSPSLKGFNYLKEAIRLEYNSPNYVNSVTKTLYPEIAKKYRIIYNDPGIKASSIERTIRSAIELSLPKMKKDDIDNIFGGIKRLTNSSYIAYATEYYKQRSDEYISTYQKKKQF